MHRDDDDWDDEDEEGLEGAPNPFWTGVALFLVIALVVWAMKGGGG